MSEAKSGNGRLRIRFTHAGYPPRFLSAPEFVACRAWDQVRGANPTRDRGASRMRVRQVQSFSPPGGAIAGTTGSDSLAPDRRMDRFPVVKTSGLEPVPQRASLRGIADELVVYEIP
jgi:hypothetical protein